MPTELFANAATTTLSGNGGSITSGATSFIVASSSLFPAAVSGTSQFRVIIGTELIIVTNVSGTTWTVTRGAEGTTAASHNDGDTITHVVTSGSVGNLLYGLGVYGDGSDGTQTFDGSTTILGMAPSSSIYTLSRDVYLAAGTINSGVTIITNNWKIFCAGTLTNNGTISYDGNNGTLGGAGAVGLGSGLGTLNINTYPAGGAGGVNNGTAGSSASSSFGGASGAGGAGGTGNGGVGKTPGVPANMSPPRALPYALIGVGLSGNGAVSLTGGAGGGGGGGDTTNSGGGGGGGGGIIFIAARKFAGTGAIHARGGNGGNGAATGNTGGGGAGGGGWVVIVSSSVSGGAIAGQTIDANPGSVGTHNGSAPAVDGHTGAAGNVYLVPN